MPEYNASLLLEGWMSLRVSAINKNEAAKLVRSSKLKILFVDGDTHEPIGSVVTSEGDHGEMTVDIEDIEVHHSDEASLYHAPARRENVDLS